MTVFFSTDTVVVCIRTKSAIVSVTDICYYDKDIFFLRVRVLITSSLSSSRRYPHVVENIPPWNEICFTELRFQFRGSLPKKNRNAVGITIILVNPQKQFGPFDNLIKVGLRGRIKKRACEDLRWWCPGFPAEVPTSHGQGSKPRVEHFQECCPAKHFSN